MKKGFTIIELMVAFTIISILLSYIMPTYFILVKNAKRAQCLANRKIITDAVEIFKGENGYYEFDINQLKEKGYIAGNIKCSAGGEYIWISTNPPILGCSVHYWPVDNSSQTINNYSKLMYPISWSDIYSTYGQWDIKDGILTNIGSNKHNLLFNIGNSSNSVKNFDMSLNFNTNGKFGVYYKTNGPVNKLNGYYLLYDTNIKKIVVYNMTNGIARSVIASATLPNNFPMTYQSHNLEITAKENSYNIKIDGVSYLNFNDSKYQSGQLGLTTSSPSKGTQITKVYIEEL
jgi:prepilin-type N-terminal cleavage/methylation domain-containing protein